MEALKVLLSEPVSSTCTASFLHVLLRLHWRHFTCLAHWALLFLPFLELVCLKRSRWKPTCCRNTMLGASVLQDRVCCLCSVVCCLPQCHQHAHVCVPSCALFTFWTAALPLCVVGSDASLCWHGAMLSIRCFMRCGKAPQLAAALVPATAILPPCWQFFECMPSALPARQLLRV
jgi:hypothetical protein